MAGGSEKDIRYEIAPTPEARLAAIARRLVILMAEPVPFVPDYADFADELRPYVQRELILARITEAQRSGTLRHILELQGALALVEREIGNRPRREKDGHG